MKLKHQLWILFAITLVTLDQFLKQWFSINFPSKVQLNLVGAGSLPWLSHEKPIWLIVTGAILISIAGYIHMSSKLNSNQRLAWTLILSGGISNWLDRLIYGGVRDIWLIYGTNLKNNLADYALTLGVIWLMIQLLTQTTDSKPKI
jgi:lipoprotein signal peptidase